MWYALSGQPETSLKQLAKEFEQKNPKVTIKLENQGSSYSDLQAKITSSLQSPSNLPTITLAYSNWMFSAAKNNLLVNLDSYIKNKNVGWGSYANSKIKSSLWTSAQISGKQYGVPFNKSAEMLFYNKTLLKKYNVKVPTTMAELKSAAQQIYKKSGGKVVGAGFDSLSNYYMLAMKENGTNFSSKINFASAASKKVINYYANGVKAGYFMQAGTQKYMSTPFSNGKVAMFVGSTANESYVQQGLNKKYSYGVAPRPSTWNIQQGTDIYMFSHASAMQKAAAFKFIKFVTSKASQLKWAEATGYMPVNTAALNSSAYKNSKNQVPKQLAATTKNLYYVPNIKNAESAYTQAGTNMQTILAQAQKKQSWTSAINSGASKFKASWQQ